MNEYNFVSKFISSYAKNNVGHTTAQPKGKNQSTYSDCEIIYKNVLLKIEAKLLKDTRSNSSNFFNLLGEAMTADKKSNILTQNYETSCSAFLIPHSSKGTFDILWKKNISVTVGNKYCNDFNVRYLLTYDHTKKTYSVFSYDNTCNCWR